MILAFDVGVTKTRVGISRNGKRLDTVRIIPTDSSYQTGVKNLIALGRLMTKGVRLKLAVGGFAGPLNAAKRSPIDCQAKDWIGRPLAVDLERGWKCQVVLENDAALNGLGEAVFGAGRGYRIVGFLTVSTGVNGVRIVDQTIDMNARGFELRNLLVPDGSGSVLPLGKIVAGSSISKRYGNPVKVLRRISVRRSVSHALAVATVNLSLAWSPDVMVLGGGIMQSVSITEIRSLVRSHWQMQKPAPEVFRGKLGDQSGLYGALVLAGSKPKSRL